MRGKEDALTWIAAGALFLTRPDPSRPDMVQRKSEGTAVEVEVRWLSRTGFIASPLSFVPLTRPNTVHSPSLEPSFCFGAPVHALDLLRGPSPLSRMSSAPSPILLRLHGFLDAALD